MEQVDKRLSVAIDFGTDGIAVAYAFGDIDSNTVFIQNEWDGAKYKAKLKPRCTVLLNKRGELVAFGKDAINTYMSLPTKKNKWMLFDRFKMSLYNCGSYTNDSDQKASVDIADVLTAVNGKKYPSEKVFVAVFKHLHEKTIDWLRNRHMTDFLKHNKIRTVLQNDIEWIITVPAIWNDNAKNKMMSWVLKAGLVDTTVAQNQCRIMYEPDCASLSMQYQIKTNNSKKKDFDEKMPSNLAKGEKYILVDAGGGTVDVACHEIVNNYKVKEIFHPSGGSWGSCYIDDQYTELLEIIFGRNWMDEFKQEAPHAYVEMIHEFQNPKADFFKKPNNDHHNVKLPYDFLQFIDDKLDDNEDYEEVDELVDDVEIDGKTGLILLEGESLEIDTSIWKSKLFDPVVNPSINHVKNLLSKPQMEDCKYLCLVGGLSRSPYFQFRMKKEFGDRLQIIIPKRPMLSVVHGAALFGLVDDYVHSRLLLNTYGIETNMPLLRGKELIEPDYSIGDKHFYCLVKANQEVFCKEIITVCSQINFHSLENEFVHMRVLCTNDENPTQDSEYTEIAAIDAEIDDDFKTEYLFYDTVVKIFAYPTHNKQKIQVQAVVPVCLATVVQTEEDQTEQKYDEITLISSEDDDPQEFVISRKAALMSKMVLSMYQCDPNQIEFRIKKIRGDIMKLIVEYLSYHNGVLPEEIAKPIRSVKMERIVADIWDAHYINKLKKKTVFQVILGANYMDIPSLLHLGCAKIATLIKGKSPEEIKNILADDSNDNKEAKIGDIVNKNAE